MSGDVAPIFDLVQDAWSGRKLGRFEVICKLGVGGMSEVFLAWQRSLGGFQRAVVLKRILDQVKGSEDFVHMFVQEAKITSSLSHGNIAQLHDLSEENGELFMVMEFVPGATLVEIARACLNTKEPIPLGLTLAVVKDTATALHYAHSFKDAGGRARPVIHRDIAEKNIMVSMEGKTKLLDFGIARQTGRSSRTQVGTVKGTAGYMSPEQVRGEKVDGRSDIFSLGIVLHECLTGQRLFKGATRVEEIEMLLNGAIPTPSSRNKAIPPPVDAIVMKALSRDRAARYGTALEVAQAIDRLSQGELWSEDQRAEFMGRHFGRRREQIRAFLGDPGMSSDGAELGPPKGDETNVKPIGDDDPQTVLAMRPNAARVPSVRVPAIAPTTAPGTPPVDPASTRDERSRASGGKTNPFSARPEDAGATLPSEGDETHSGSQPGLTGSEPGLAPLPGENTLGTNPSAPLPGRRRGVSRVNLQLVGMIGGGAALVLLILLVLFW